MYAPPRPTDLRQHLPFTRTASEVPVMPTHQDSCRAEVVSTTWLPCIKARKTNWKLVAHIAKNHIVPQFGSQGVAGVTENDVRRRSSLFERQHCAQATRNRRLHEIRSIFGRASEHGLPSAAPSRCVQSRHVKNARCPSLDDARLEALLITLHLHSDRKAKALALILLTGAQKREILNARWENLFLEEGILLAPRASGLPARKLRLSYPARKIVRSIRRQGASPWMFPGKHASVPLSYILQFWQEMRISLGLGVISIRDMRYFFADWQLRTGISPIALQLGLGRGDERCTPRNMTCEQEEVRQ